MASAASAAVSYTPPDQQSIIAATLRRTSADGCHRARLIAHCLRHAMQQSQQQQLGLGGGNADTMAAGSPINTNTTAAKTSKIGGLTFVTLTPDLLEDFLPPALTAATHMMRGRGGGPTAAGGIASTSKNTSLFSVADKARAALERHTSSKRSVAAAEGAEDTTDGDDTGDDEVAGDDGSPKQSKQKREKKKPQQPSSSTTTASSIARLLVRSSVADVLPMAMGVGVGPRCTFVCGQGGVLLRSVDRCRTWRRIRVPLLDDADDDSDDADTNANTSDADEEEDDDDDTKLNDILSLMVPSNAAGGDGGSAKGRGAAAAAADGDNEDDDDDDEIEGIAAYLRGDNRKRSAKPTGIVKAILDEHNAASKKKRRTTTATNGSSSNGRRRGEGTTTIGASSTAFGDAASSSQSDILAMSTFGDDIVVIAGQNGLLAVSVDRGAQFVRLPTRLLLKGGSTTSSGGGAAVKGGGGGGGAVAANPSWFRDKTNSANQFVSFLGAVVVGPSTSAPSVASSLSTVSGNKGPSSSTRASSSSPSSSFRVIFHTSNRAFSVAFTPTSLHGLVYGDTIETLIGGGVSGGSGGVMTTPPPMPIGCVEAIPLYGPQQQQCMVVITTPSCLHISLDGGRSLLRLQQPMSDGGEQKDTTANSNNAAHHPSSSSNPFGIKHQAGLIRAIKALPILTAAGSSSAASSSLALIEAELGREEKDSQQQQQEQRHVDGEMNTTAAAASATKGSAKAFTYTTATPVTAPGLVVAAAASSTASASSSSAVVSMLGPHGGRAKSSIAQGLLLDALQRVRGGGSGDLSSSPPSLPPSYGCTFVVFGSDGPLVNFDFTALMHVSVSSGSGGNAATTTATKVIVSLENVQHTPFVTTGPSERVGLGVYRGSLGGLGSSPPPASDGDGRPSSLSPSSSLPSPLTIVRSNRAGVSVSTDHGRSWSRPVHAYTGSVCLPPSSSLGGGGGGGGGWTLPPCVLVGGSKQCVVLSDTGFLAAPPPTLPTASGRGATNKGGGAAAANNTTAAATGASSPSPSSFEVIPIASQHRVKMLYGIAAIW